MLKSASFALALLIGASALVPTTLVPTAIEAASTGPCHYCEMEPIVVIGKRPKKAKSSSQKQIQQQPSVATGVRSK